MKTTLEEMQAFVTVVDTGSITAAATQLNQTISATSRTLARLEEKLHTTLLRRTTRRLQLTEEGKAFLHRARQILAAVEETEEHMTLRRNQPSGLLRVDAASPFMLHVIVPLVTGFRARYPQVELELDSNEGITDLLQKRTDLAIRIGSLKDSTLHARLVGHSRIRVLASPDYLSRHGAPADVAALTGHTLLGFNQPDTLNDWPLLDNNGLGLHITPNICSSSGETLRQLALQGAGITCLSDFMTAEDRRHGRLRQILEAQTVDIRKPIHAVYYRNTALSSRIQCFLDYLLEAIEREGFS